MATLVLENIARIQRHEVRFFIDVRSPTKFLLREFSQVPMHAATVTCVTLGANQGCTCRKPHCIHVLYVLMRFYGVPPESNLLRLNQLSEGDIDTILERRYLGKAGQRVQAPEARVVRRTVTHEDVCPICYESLTGAGDVAWCSTGCGGNFHLKCVRAWIQARLNQGEHGSCPICRVQLDVPDCSGDLVVRRDDPPPAPKLIQAPEPLPKPEPVTKLEPAPRPTIRGMAVMARRLPPVDQRREAVVEYAKSQGLRDIEEFLANARQMLAREQKLYEAQQKRIERAIETHKKASEEAPSAQRATVAPVVSIKLPDVFSRTHATIRPSQSEPRPSTTLVLNKTAPIGFFIQREGNINDALSLTQQNLENERRANALLAQRLAMTPVRKRHQTQRNPRPRVSPCVGWST